MATGEELKRERRWFFFCLCVVMALHVAVISSAILVQLNYSRSHPPLTIVSVSLVSLPGKPASSQPAGSAMRPSPAAPVPPPAPQSVARSSGKSVPEPELARPPKVPEAATAKKNLSPENAAQKKTGAADAREKARSLDKALEQLREKTAKEKPPDRFSDVFDNLQKRVAAQGAGASKSSGASSGAAGQGSGGASESAYKATIARIIQRNWNFSRQLLSSSSGMEVRVSINIDQDGSISQIRYDRKSPSEYLNSSVRSAIEKSNPLPPLPQEISSEELWVRFVFTPEGLGR